jgi:hypothetical protein
MGTRHLDSHRAFICSGGGKVYLMMSCLSSPVLDMATVVHMLLVVVSSRSTT